MVVGADLVLVLAAEGVAHVAEGVGDLIQLVQHVDRRVGEADRRPLACWASASMPAKTGEARLVPPIRLMKNPSVVAVRRRTWSRPPRGRWTGRRGPTRPGSRASGCWPWQRLVVAEGAVPVVMSCLRPRSSRGSTARRPAGTTAGWTAVPPPPPSRPRAVSDLVGRRRPGCSSRPTPLELGQRVDDGAPARSRTRGCSACR